MRSKRNSHQHRTVSFADRHTGVSAVLVLASGERRDHVQSTATCFLQVVHSDTVVIADARTIDVVVEVILRHLPNPLWSREANPGSVIRLLGTGCRRGGDRGSLPQALGFGAQRVPRG